MAEKSGPKSGKRPGTFVKGGDPRQGRGPKPGAPNAGRPRSAFLEAMRGIVDRHETLARLRALTSRSAKVSDETFLRAFKEAADRGYGKAVQPLEHSGPEGGPIPLATPDELRGDIARELDRLARAYDPGAAPRKA